MSSLDVKRVIGKGAFGEVQLAWWSGGHVEVAVKANGEVCANTAAIEQEKALLDLLLRHPHANIIVVYGICLDAADGAVRLVMKYCEGGSLDAHLIQLRSSGKVLGPPLCPLTPTRRATTRTCLPCHPSSW